MGQVEKIPPESARRAGRPMSREQFVFLGAGASHGCRTLPLDGVDPTGRSPVVAEHFDERYSWARDSYPLVREVAAMSQPIIARRCRIRGLPQGELPGLSSRARARALLVGTAL